MKNLIYDMDDLPGNTTIGIYGAGKFGHYTKRYIEAYRPDITVACYIDSYKEGRKDGIPINLASRIHDLAGIDAIVIASHYWKQILDSLNGSSIPAYLLHPLLNLGVIITEREFAARKQHIEEAASLFSEASRKVYLDLIGKRVLTREQLRNTPFDDTGSLSTLHQVFGFYPRNGQAYEDFVDFRSMRAIIEGGVFDGSNTQRFAALTGDDCDIYAFEPFIEVFRSSPLAKPLLENERVNIVPQGLWSSKSARPLYKSGSGSCVVEESEASGQTIEVPLTSIDAFARDNALERVDYIKLDIEGAETEALKGAANTIRACSPQMAVAIYHTKDDMIDIPLHLAREHGSYRFEIGHYSTGVFETILYALPS